MDGSLGRGEDTFKYHHTHTPDKNPAQSGGHYATENSVVVDNTNHLYDQAMVQAQPGRPGVYPGRHRRAARERARSHGAATAAPARKRDRAHRHTRGHQDW